MMMILRLILKFTDCFCCRIIGLGGGGGRETGERKCIHNNTELRV